MSSPGKLPKIRRTNEVMVQDLMRRSEFGAIGQVFIVEAIRYYSEKIANSPTPQTAGEGVISAITWHQIACDVDKRLKENFE